jgi:hypothetical protein
MCLETPSITPSEYAATAQDLRAEHVSKTLPFFDEEYDEEEDILICGLPYPLFGSKKKDESNSQRGLQKNDD